ncbi:MAG: hypothetical protein HQL88_03235 [Magnetococcales bacterium]|nr:hypothetical protein [Magnetococcales bacterium]
MNKLFYTLLVCCTTLLAGAAPREADAFALGELQLLGKPNQPFRAISPITLDPDEKILSVTIGSDADYLLLNMTRKGIVDEIVPQLKEEEGRLLVSLQSTGPVREQDFHVLLRISSNHHTYFPFFRIQQAAVDASQKKAVQAKAGASAQTTQTAQTAQTAKANPPPSQGMAKGNKLYGPVRKGEGLRDIAISFQTDNSLSVAQLEVAIWLRNQNHFIRNNIHGMKSGVKLTIPAPEEIAAIDKQEADALLLNHAAEWKKSPKKQARMTAPSGMAAALAAAGATAQAKPPSPPPQAVSASQEPDPSPAKEPPQQPVAAPAKEPSPQPVAAPAKEPSPQPVKSGQSPSQTLAQTPPGEEHETPAKTTHQGGQVKVESGALQAILVQLQAITRVLENHHERQEQLEKRVTNLEKNLEQRDQLEKRVSNLEQSMKEWNFLTKERRVGPEGNKSGGVPISVNAPPPGKEGNTVAPK